MKYMVQWVVDNVFEVYLFDTKSDCEHFLRQAFDDGEEEGVFSVFKVGSRGSICEWCRTYKYRNVQEFFKDR